MLHGFSNLLTRVFDVLVLPFGDNRTAALWGLSLLTGVALIFLFKATSDQARIRAARDAFKARILEMRVYQDDIALILKALGGAMWTNVTYLRASLKPIVVLLVVALPVFIQLDERYGRAGLEDGNTTLLTVSLKDGVDPLAAPVTADGGGAVSLDSPPVRVHTEKRDGAHAWEVSWRIRIDGAGVHPFAVSVYDTPYRFPVTAAVTNRAIGYTRTANSTFDPLFHPALPAIPKNSAIRSVHVHYPEAAYSLVFWDAPWWVVFLVLLSVGAIIPKFLFGIEV